MSRLLLPLLALLLLVGCDAVERPDRWREDPAPIVPRRNVLLVDFTGQRCSNCPAAADLLHSLTAGPAGARIIAVSVHGGALALSTDASPRGLAGPDARRLTDEARVSSWPQGTVDRPVGGTLLRPSAWNAALAEHLALAADADAAAQQSLVADAHVALATRTLSYTLRPRHLTDAAGQADAETYLHLWLVEDSITAPQTLADGTERADYLHRHVLRLDLTGPAAHRLAAPRPGSSAPAMTRPAATPQAYALTRSTNAQLATASHPSPQSADFTRSAGTAPRSTDARSAAASHFAPSAATPLPASVGSSAAAQPTSPESPGTVAGADPYRVHGEIKLPVGLGLSARFATTTRFNLRRLTLVAFLTRGVHGPVGAVAATRVEVR
jgi:putativeouter membrane protein omp28